MDRYTLMRTSRARNAPTWRQFALVTTLTLVSCASTRQASAAQSLRIDEAHTSIGFKIDAMGFPTTLGHFSHYSGRILIDLARLIISETDYPFFLHGTLDRQFLTFMFATAREYEPPWASMDVSRNVAR